MPSIRDSLRRTDGSTELPRVSEWLLGAFARYTHWYLHRHFDALRVSASGWLPDNENGVPKVVYLNHASWWDPLVCLHLSREQSQAEDEVRILCEEVALLRAELADVRNQIEVRRGPVNGSEPHGH